MGGGIMFDRAFVNQLPKNKKMNDDDIKQFIECFETFMDRADVEILNYMRRETHRKYQQSYYEHKAAELNVAVDYYIQEFT